MKTECILAQGIYALAFGTQTHCEREARWFRRLPKGSYDIIDTGPPSPPPKEGDFDELTGQRFTNGAWSITA